MGMTKKVQWSFAKVGLCKGLYILNQEFVLEVLHARGFGTKWIDWIKTVLFGGKSQIMVNGVTSNIIVFKRGLRQGDPLSPLLFVLAADVFVKMLDLAVQNGILNGLRHNNYLGNLLSLQYADDTFLFVKTDIDSLRAIKLLYGFELVSGLKLNFNKSLVY